MEMAEYVGRFSTTAMNGQDQQGNIPLNTLIGYLSQVEEEDLRVVKYVALNTNLERFQSGEAIEAINLQIQGHKEELEKAKKCLQEERKVGKKHKVKPLGTELVKKRKALLQEYFKLKNMGLPVSPLQVCIASPAYLPILQVLLEEFRLKVEIQTLTGTLFSMALTKDNYEVFELLVSKMDREYAKKIFNPFALLWLWNDTFIRSNLKEDHNFNKFVQVYG
mmetsp:Transcript_9925/g.9817  ORF Transcript_9925/g.9817 Transcript_9925/m.9817 type:complete len:221 (+) Transcript_9925:1219-1881(+)